VFVTRHPLANAISHSKVLRDSTLPELVAHWIAVATYMRVNENYLAHVLSIKFEDFCAAPADGLAAVWAFLGVDADASLAAAATVSIRRDPNALHKAAYCGPVTAGHAGAVREHAVISDTFGAKIEAEHNYTIGTWCEVDGY